MREVLCDDTGCVIEPVSHQIGNGNVKTVNNMMGGSGGLNPEESTYYIPLKQAGRDLYVERARKRVSQTGVIQNYEPISTDTAMRHQIGSGNDTDNNMTGGSGGLDPEESTYYIPLKQARYKKSGHKRSSRKAKQTGGKKRPLKTVVKRNVTGKTRQYIPRRQTGVKIQVGLGRNKVGAKKRKCVRK